MSEHDAVVAALAALAPQADPVFQRNLPYAKPSVNNYQTPLTLNQEKQFQAWVAQNKVPYDPSPTTDYDMKGFWLGLTTGHPQARQGVDPNDSQMHFSDYWKTPYHETFSAESQWANPETAPRWNEKDQLVAADGTVVYDDRMPKVDDFGATLLKAMMQ